MNIHDLSASERILLAQQLWDSVHREADEISVSEAQTALLDDRLAALAADGNPGDSWENVKRRITRRASSA